MATPSAFAKKLAVVAQQQHAKFQFTNEADPLLCKQIRRWTEDIGFSFSSCTKVPWSAVFISWCVMQAGATKAEFKFAMAHSVFANQAIKNALKRQRRRNQIHSRNNVFFVSQRTWKRTSGNRCGGGER